MKTAISLLLVLALVAGGVGYYLKNASTEIKMAFRTANVTTGDLTATISATGTLEPVQVVDVGSQVTGVISKLEQDPRGKTDSHYKNKIIEWNSPVCGPDSKSGKPHGTVMARIDDRLYKAAYDQAKANLAKAQADQEVNKARLVQSEADWSRAQQLRPDPRPQDGETQDARRGYVKNRSRRSARGFAIQGHGGLGFRCSEGHVPGGQGDDRRR